jgi:activator of HSP90 ATPase
MIKTKTLRQTVTFNASPHEVYEALMDSKKHSAFTGDKAVISRKVGGSFKAYGDYIESKNIELIPDKKIVQSWRSSDWPKGHYSKVIFDFKELGKKTKLYFVHEDVPEDQYAEIKQGWNDFYWTPMKAIF